jgi:hypothetical protein
MIFWWFYPRFLKQWFITRWRAKLPDWTEMIEGTTVVSRRELQALFPEAQVVVERFLGFPKSYVAYHVNTGPGGA